MFLEDQDEDIEIPLSGGTNELEIGLKRKKSLDGNRSLSVSAVSGKDSAAVAVDATVDIDDDADYDDHTHTNRSASDFTYSVSDGASSVGPSLFDGSSPGDYNGVGGGFHSSHSQRQNDAYHNSATARGQRQRILWSKVCVFSVLFLAVISVATSAYLIISREETEDFESRFANYASEIITVTQEKVSKTFDAAKGFSITLSSYAKRTNQTWPYVILEDFSVRSEQLKKLTSANRIGWSPIVETNQRPKWESFVQENLQGYYEECFEQQQLQEPPIQHYLNNTSPLLFTFNASNPVETFRVITEDGPYIPLWQLWPLDPNLIVTNYNMLTGVRIKNGFDLMNATYQTALNFIVIYTNAEAQILQPIYEEIILETDDANMRAEKKLVGLLTVVIDWSEYFKNILSDRTKTGLVAVLENACQEGDFVSYQINGPEVVYLGEGDHHDTEYDDLKISAPFVDIEYDPTKLPEDACAPSLEMHIYPSKSLEESFHTNAAIIYTVVVVLIFAFTSSMFLIYDFFVRQRQRQVMEKVLQQDKIVSNVFPKAIRERLYQNAQHNAKQQREMAANKKGPQESFSGGDPNLKMEFLDEDDDLGFGEHDSWEHPDILGSSSAPPLAELFPSVTLFFGDIAGFTAWSSAREPQQVFMLLESIYGAFDRIAYRHNVFKVETVGDCYVAVAGLPEPNDHHATTIARFARSCVRSMKDMTKKLVVTLGPDTSDLELRVGIHSGQVTAGVLRGERCRFQLFGDTMNTAARMESTSKRNQIQISGKTAELLRVEGLSEWIHPRKNLVDVKGKGEMQTFWLETKAETYRRQRKNRRKTPRSMAESETAKSSSGSTTKQNDDHTSVSGVYDADELSSSGSDRGGTGDDMEEEEDDPELSKAQLVVEWNVEMLCTLLQQMIAARGDRSSKTMDTSWRDPSYQGANHGKESINAKKTVLEEFKPIIHLKRFDVKELQNRKDPASIDLGENVRNQLRDFLTIISGMYRNNAFHNFEHASHVTASVRKLLSRIVDTSGGDKLQKRESTGAVNLVDLAGHSYGITSDPMTQFAVLFSAIIHDVDHPGVPNTQLVKEQTRHAMFYKKSIAEQNSVDLAWGLLMSPDYKDLRACMFSCDEDMKRFRQLVVNTVMATDICDKELQALRKARWEVAFSGTSVSSEVKTESTEASEDRKATIVIEHLIQASDVVHTMQHWRVYELWNERFFFECYGAYRAGRAEEDPSIGWYKGEIGFFDFYVIPLAKKLASCGVFGVSSDEYLNYAQSNRDEWERKGEKMVAKYLERYNEMQVAKRGGSK